MGRSAAPAASTRFTFDGGSWPIWSPDGRKIAFESDRTGVAALVQKPAPSITIVLNWSAELKK